MTTSYPCYALNSGLFSLFFIVAVPFPAQGHLNQLLHFCLQLSLRNFTSIHYATTPSHLLQAQNRLHGWTSSSLHTINFHALHSPPFLSPPPNPNSTTKFPIHLIPSFYASNKLQSPLSSLLHSLSTTCRRLVIIHDSLMSFVCHLAASIPNAESFHFPCVPSFHMDTIFSPPGFGGIRERTPEFADEFFEVIEFKDDDALPDELMEFLFTLNFDLSASSGFLFNSCRSIDGDFFDQLEQSEPYVGKKMFLIGPLNPTTQIESERRHECLKWLDQQPYNSVVYISFGTTTVFSDKQIGELAKGLKSSGHRFVWVLRDADRGDIFAGGGEEDRKRGLEEEIGEGRGLIIRGWAPQLEILGHKAVAAFMSHCGWNSCMESLSMGVPIIAWPLHSDQPRNAVMVTRYLKMGIEVRDCRGKEVVLGEDIQNVIVKMMDSEEGKAIGKKARVLGEEIRMSLLDGGSSKAHFDAFVDYICR